MSAKRELMEYYKRKLYRGRSPFSRAVDYLAVRIMIFMGCYLWFSLLIANDVAKMLLSLASTAFISVSLDLINSLRLDKFISAERKRATEDGLSKRLLYLTSQERMELVREYLKSNPELLGSNPLIFNAHRPGGVSEEDVVNALRSARERHASQAYIFHIGKPSKEAFAVASTCPEVDVSFVDMRSTLTAEREKQLTPSESDIDKALLSAAGQQRQKIRSAVSAPFSRGRTRRYVTAAASLLALSFFVEYAIYYRLMAAACMLFGATSWWLNRAGGASH